MIAATPPVVVAAPAQLPPGMIGAYPSNDWHFNGELIYPAVGSPVTWVQTTVKVPAVPAWTAPGQVEDGWVMGQARSGTATYTQIGWKMSEGIAGSGPHLFIESNGVADTETFPQYPMTPGGSYNVAVSCDLGTTTYHDWLQVGFAWKLIASPTLSVSCANGIFSRTDETFSPNGLSPFNAGTFSNTIIDDNGSEMGIQ